MLGPEVAGANVLDLFAGSGALGIEAISRGAATAIFVERDAASAGVIRRNLETLGYSSVSRVEIAEVVRWLRAHPAEVGAASIALVDPPYNDAVLDRTLALLDEAVPEGAAVVVERGAAQPLSGLRRLHATRERRYGDTAVSVLRAASAS